MEAKHRVKMHKVKKHWVAIGMTVLALTSLGAVKVSADETSPVAQADSTSQVQPSANKPVATIDTTASVDKLDNQTEESTNQSDTSSDTTVKASDLADSVPMDQAIPVAETNNGTANSDKQATPADQTQPQAQPTNTEQPATERLQVNPNLPKGTSYRGFHEVNGKAYYFNDQGDAVANQFVTYHYISPTLIDPYNSPHFEVNHYYYYYLDGDGQKVGGWLSLNNERYYFDPDNYQQYRNTVKKIGESVYTFDNEGRVVPNDSPDIGVSFTVPLYLKADESGKKFLYVRTSDYKITNQKGITKDGNIKIQSLTKGKNAEKELSKFLEKVDKSDLKSLEDFDHLFGLKTKEVIVAQSKKDIFYNLIQKDGTMVSFSNDRYRLRSLYFEPKELKKAMTYRKVAMSQAFVGKWKMYNENNSYNETITISKNGILTRRQSDPEVFAVYSLEEAEKDEALKNGAKFSEEKFKEKFYEIQSKLESQGYHVNNPKDIYKKVGDYFYFLVTNGGKTIVVLTNHFEYNGKIEKTN